MTTPLELAVPEPDAVRDGPGSPPRSLPRRIAPAVALLVLAPLVAEFLLGDFSVRQVGFLVVFVPQYGGGAVLVRELTRRARRGWGTMILLALAYALIEEGFTTQTLFNPNYAGQRLLDYGFIPALGTSLDWSVFVLTLHVVWSVGSSVAIAEGLAGTRWATPWLGKVALGVTTALYLVGCALTTSFTLKTFPFVASPMQFASVAVAVVLVVAAALFGPRTGGTNTENTAPRSVLVGAVAFVLSSGFYILYSRGPATGLHPAVTLCGMLALEATAVAAFTLWSRRAGWGASHAVAAATGAILTYGWVGISHMAGGRTALGTLTTPFDVVGQVILLAAVLVVCAVAWRRRAA